MNKRKYSFDLVSVCADFLNSNFEHTVTDDVKAIISSGVSDELAVRLLIGEGGGLDTFGKDRRFFNEYFPLCVKKLDDNIYTQDEYYKNIVLNGKKDGNVELCYEKYKQYEPFVFSDLSEDFKGTVIPQIGFFDKEFVYPAVKENGVLWMSVTPNEINTIKEPISVSCGKTLTLGLGLGYFAYMCSIKDSVKQVTVVERNEKVISLFNENILPQFPHPEKIKIIKSDGIEFFKNPTETDFDFVFCDLWHDVSDGIPLMQELKKYEKNFPKAVVKYWIEKSMKYYL